MQVRKKVETSRNTAFFQWFVALEGRTVGSLNRAGAEPAGQMRDEQLHTVVARSTLWSQKWKKKTDGLRPLLEVEMMKKCTPLWRETHFQVKLHETPHVRSTFGSWHVEKAHAVVWRKARFEVSKMQKTDGYGADGVSRGRPKGLRTLSKVSKTWGICRISKNIGRWDTWRGSVRCMWRSRRNTEQRSGRRFPERGCILEHEIFRLLRRDRSSTSYDLASLFRGKRSTLNRWNGKIATRIGTRPSALLSTFHFWRKSRRTPSYLMLSTSELLTIGEVVQKYCCVFDAVQFENWASLAE